MLAGSRAVGKDLTDYFFRFHPARKLRPEASEPSGGKNKNTPREFSGESIEATKP
jgi:hypothetical protein